MRIHLKWININKKPKEKLQMTIGGQKLWYNKRYQSPKIAAFITIDSNISGEW